MQDASVKIQAKPSTSTAKCHIEHEDAGDVPDDNLLNPEQKDRPEAKRSC